MSLDAIEIAHTTIIDFKYSCLLRYPFATDLNKKISTFYKVSYGLVLNDLMYLLMHRYFYLKLAEIY
jgi:hypothetical protein